MERPEIRERVVVPTPKLKVKELLWLLGVDMVMTSSQRYTQAAVLRLDLSKNHNYITCFGIDFRGSNFSTPGLDIFSDGLSPINDFSKVRAFEAIGGKYVHFA